MATIYYVNKSGSDSASGTSAAFARLTIGAGLSLLTSNGDKLIVQSGNYKEQVNFDSVAPGLTYTFECDGTVVVDGEGIRSYCMIGGQSQTSSWTFQGDRLELKNATVAAMFGGSSSFYWNISTFENFVIHSCPYGLYFPNNRFMSSPSTIRNGLIYGCSSYGIYKGANVSDSRNITIHNVTITACGTGLTDLTTNNTTATHQYSNLVITNCTTLMELNITGSNKTLILDYNHYYFTGGANVKWGATPTIETTLAGWQTTTGQEANGTDGDPLYNDSAREMYTLKQTSPAAVGGYVNDGLPLQRGHVTNEVYAVSNSVNSVDWTGATLVNTQLNVGNDYEIVSGTNGAVQIDSDIGFTTRVREIYPVFTGNGTTQTIDKENTDTQPNRMNFEYRYSNISAVDRDAQGWTTAEWGEDLNVVARWFAVRATLRNNDVEA